MKYMYQAVIISLFRITYIRPPHGSVTDTVDASISLYCLLKLSITSDTMVVGGSTMRRCQCEHMARCTPTGPRSPDQASSRAFIQYSIHTCQYLIGTYLVQCVCAVRALERTTRHARWLFTSARTGIPKPLALVPSFYSRVQENHESKLKLW